MSTLKVPVTDQDHAKGPADAPITLVEYGDYQCPFCATAHLKLKKIDKELDGRIRLIFRQFPLTQVHEYAFLGAMSAEAAGVQGKFWEMSSLLFENQELLDPAGVVQIAEALELNLGQFRKSLQSKTLANRIKQDFMGGVRSGIEGTPTFFLNGHKFNGPLEVSVFKDLLAAA